MLLFVLTALAIYTAMHLLVFWGIHPLLAGHPLLPTLNWLWMGLMILAPLLVRLLERGGQELAARALAWVGYCWMGLVFIAFSLCTVLAGWETLVWIFGRVWSWAAQLSVHGPISAALVVAVTLGAGLYGLYEAGHLRVETVRLASAKLPAGSPTLRIVQVSDLHLGLINRENTLAPLVAELQRLQPDLLLATGDVVDAQINHLEELAGLWRQVQPPLGKFAVTGNHEIYAGLDQALEFLDASGFRVLRGETASLPTTSPWPGSTTRPARRSEERRRCWRSCRRRSSPSCSTSARGSPGRRRGALTCSSPATPTAARSFPSTSSPASNTRCRTASIPCPTAATSTPAAAPAPGARRCAFSPRRS